MLLMYVVSWKNPDIASEDKKTQQVDRNINCWASTSPSCPGNKEGFSFSSLRLFPAASGQDSLCFASFGPRPWQAAAGCGKPQTQSKITTWQKEDADALKPGERMGPC